MERCDAMLWYGRCMVGGTYLEGVGYGMLADCCDASEIFRPSGRRPRLGGAIRHMHFSMPLQIYVIAAGCLFDGHLRKAVEKSSRGHQASLIHCRQFQERSDEQISLLANLRGNRHLHSTSAEERAVASRNEAKQKRRAAKESSHKALSRTAIAVPIAIASSPPLTNSLSPLQ